MMKSMILLPVAVGFAVTGCASERWHSYES